MRFPRLFGAAVVALAAAAPAVSAHHSFAAEYDREKPLKVTGAVTRIEWSTPGTWHGTWGPTAAQRNDVTIVMEYDGKTISGLLNPGPDGTRFDTITLEPNKWAVHFEATPKGAKAPIVIDATLQDVTNRRRTLTGTWMQGSVKGDFKMSRDD